AGTYQWSVRGLVDSDGDGVSEVIGPATVISFTVLSSSDAPPFVQYVNVGPSNDECGPVNFEGPTWAPMQTWPNSTFSLGDWGVLDIAPEFDSNTLENPRGTEDPEIYYLDSVDNEQVFLSTDPAYELFSCRAYAAGTDSLGFAFFVGRDGVNTRLLNVVLGFAEQFFEPGNRVFNVRFFGVDSDTVTDLSSPGQWTEIDVDGAADRFTNYDIAEQATLRGSSNPDDSAFFEIVSVELQPEHDILVVVLENLDSEDFDNPILSAIGVDGR
ncbi:MAG: hypothetical protein ACFB51_15070, partial [Anaerolineae bacterium]